MQKKIQDRDLSKSIKAAIRELGGSFVPFKHIIREILREYGSFDNLNGKTVIELGPGFNFRMIEYLARYAKVEAAGLNTLITEPPEFYMEKYLYDYLFSKPENSIDLIYSRRVMENYSFDPALLVKSPAYEKLRTNGPSNEVWVDYPGARLNIIRCYIEAFKALKPGGIIISHIGNRIMARFHQNLPRQLGFELVVRYPFRWIGQMWVFRKPYK